MSYLNSSDSGFIPTKKDEIYRNYAYSRLVETGMSETMAFRLSKMTKTVSFEEGETVWKKGKPAEAWCHIIKGCVGLTTNSKKNTFEPLGVFSENAWFGEQHIVSNICTHADYVCLSDTELLMIPKKYISECLEQDIGFSAYLAKLMAWRIQKASESLMLMKSENRCMRVVMGIYSIAETIARDFDHPAILEKEASVQIPFTQGLLAAFCGVSRTIFSQHVRRLFKAGLLNIAYGSIEINNMKVWERFAETQKSRSEIHLDLSMSDMLLEFKKAVESQVDDEIGSSELRRVG